MNTAAITPLFQHSNILIGAKPLTSGVVIQIGKMAVTPYLSLACMNIGHCHYSTLDVRCWTFIRFFSDQTGRFIGQRQR
jgi:hypothetical protein